MKTNNRDCKIVQDLLPNYLENLTHKVTNEYIEEHIATCANCAQVLKDMNGELKLEQINQEHEIKYLDAIRRKVRRIIIAVTATIILIAGCFVGYVHKKSQIQVNNYTFLKASYIRENQPGTVDGNVYGVVIASIDENNRCKSFRIVESGYIDSTIQEMYDQINNKTKHVMNAKIENMKLYYNINIYNGCTKEQVKEKLFNSYNVEKIEEI